jgi:exo-beta-1,3-glucanase (GH17 family)
VFPPGANTSAPPPPARHASLTGDSPDPEFAKEPTREQPFVRRIFRPFIGERWIGNAVAYSPYRDGQRPGGPGPTRDQLRQDLRLLEKRWGLIRLYAARGPAETILELIHEEHFALRVMLGAWIGAEARYDRDGRIVEELPAMRAANRAEVEAACRLAAAYPEIVLAVSVGNETQVSWSDHRVPADRLVAYLRAARACSRVPVTTADDFAFWKEPASVAVADETDFIVTHLHPLWNGQPLARALDWTRRTFAEVQAAHPGLPTVIGETGWATRRNDEGDQGKLMKGRLGEREQKVFYDAFTAWATRQRVPAFFFEAFDENWTGGARRDDVEKHWGLLHADRSPKKAMADGR